MPLTGRKRWLAATSATSVVRQPLREGTKLCPTAMRIPPETSSGQVFRLRGKGVPHLKGGGHGDQFVTVKLVAPRNMDARSQELLREFARLNPGDPRRGRR